MLRTKVDEIGYYYRKKMIFSIFSKNHFQKSRVGPENRFRISRFFIQPKPKKNAGHRPESCPAAPRNPFCLQIGNAKVHFSNQKTRKKWHFSKMPPHSPSQKKATRPKTSHLRPLQYKNDKSLKPTPKIHHSQRNNPKGKTFPDFQARQCVWNPYLKAHPPFHFSKIDASSLENQRFIKISKLFTF